MSQTHGANFLMLVLLQCWGLSICMTCLLSLKQASIDVRRAYCSIICSAVTVRSVVNNVFTSYPLSSGRQTTTWRGRSPATLVQRAWKTNTLNRRFSPNRFTVICFHRFFFAAFFRAASANLFFGDLMRGPYFGTGPDLLRRVGFATSFRAASFRINP